MTVFLAGIGFISWGLLEKNTVFYSSYIELVCSGMWLRDAEGKEHVSQSDRRDAVSSYKTHFVCMN